MKKERPVNLDLNTIAFPPSAISSILHRVTGVAMFFALIFVMWAWAQSLASAEGFDFVKQTIDGIVGKIVLIGTVVAFSYHLLAGIRHMIMDAGYWEDLQSGNRSAEITIGLWIVVSIILGVALW